MIYHCERIAVVDLIICCWPLLLFLLLLLLLLLLTIDNLLLLLLLFVVLLPLAVLLFFHLVAMGVRAGGVIDQCKFQQRREDECQANARPHVDGLSISSNLNLQSFSLIKMAD